MASVFFQNIIKENHLIQDETVIRLSEDGSELVEYTPDPRSPTDEELEQLPDSIGYSLMCEQTGFSRSHVAFLRWTFERLGTSLTPDQKAVDFWNNLPEAVEHTFEESCDIRAKAESKFGVELTNDYLRATTRHSTKEGDLYQIGLLLLKELTEDYE